MLQPLEHKVPLYVAGCRKLLQANASHAVQGSLTPWSPLPHQPEDHCSWSCHALLTQAASPQLPAVSPCHVSPSCAALPQPGSLQTCLPCSSKRAFQHQQHPATGTRSSCIAQGSPLHPEKGRGGPSTPGWYPRLYSHCCILQYFCEMEGLRQRWLCHRPLSAALPKMLNSKTIATFIIKQPPLVFC